LLGRRFSFTPGSRNGETDITAIRFSQDWVSRSLSQVFAARSTMSLGIDAFGATNNNDSVPDSQFFAWLGQFQWARRIGARGSEILFRADGQIADETLFPLERFAVGGLDSVRGYRRFQLVRDEGFSASLEFRYPIVRDHPDFGTLQLAPFYDIGGAWNRDEPTPSPETISSAGLGLRWDPDPKFHAELYWGHAFNNVDNPNNTLQDDGVHFRLRADLF
jgi:hemolysin activation/secretion protein